MPMAVTMIARTVVTIATEPDAHHRASQRQRKKVEILFAHLKLDRMCLRGPNGAKDEFLLADIAQNLRKMGKLIPMPAPKIAERWQLPRRIVFQQNETFATLLSEWCVL